MGESGGPVVIPFRKLSAEAAQGVIEEFVTREGTDYGGVGVRLPDKVRQVREQLERGEAVLVYDPRSNSCNIVPADGAWPPTPPPGGSSKPTCKPARTGASGG